jgi:hypothetical protein
LQQMAHFFRKLLRRPDCGRRSTSLRSPSLACAAVLSCAVSEGTRDLQPSETLIAERERKRERERGREREREGEGEGRERERERGRETHMYIEYLETYMRTYTQLCDLSPRPSTHITLGAACTLAESSAASVTGATCTAIGASASEGPCRDE